MKPEATETTLFMFISDSAKPGGIFLLNYCIPCGEMMSWALWKTYELVTAFCWNILPDILKKLNETYT